jgi:hypothetical protein
VKATLIRLGYLFVKYLENKYTIMNLNLFCADYSSQEAQFSFQRLGTPCKNNMSV